VGLAAAAVLALVLYLMPREGARREMTDLPWQVEVLPGGGYRVFGLDLGRATFGDAVRKFGEPEAVAVFVSPDGGRSLEAYFGKRNVGGLEARIIAVLELPSGLVVPGDGEAQPSGAVRHTLPTERWAALHGQRILALTYSPTYGGLDEAYLVTRFGTPEARHALEDGRVRLEYPSRGITLHVDPQGREVFEYRAPAPDR
jgi:hypothetical protein